MMNHRRICSVSIFLTLLLISNNAYSSYAQYPIQKEQNDHGQPPISIVPPIPLPSPLPHSVHSIKVAKPISKRPKEITINTYDDEYVKRAELLASFKRKPTHPHPHPQSSLNSHTKLTRQSLRAQELKEEPQITQPQNTQSQFDQFPTEFNLDKYSNFTRVHYSYWNSSVYCRPSCYFFDAENWVNNTYPTLDGLNVVYVSVDMSLYNSSMPVSIIFDNSYHDLNVSMFSFGRVVVDSNIKLTFMRINDTISFTCDYLTVFNSTVNFVNTAVRAMSMSLYSATIYQSGEMLVGTIYSDVSSLIDVNGMFRLQNASFHSPVIFRDDAYIVANGLTTHFKGGLTSRSSHLEFIGGAVVLFGESRVKNIQAQKIDIYGSLIVDNCFWVSNVLQRNGSSLFVDHSCDILMSLLQLRSPDLVSCSTLIRGSSIQVYTAQSWCNTTVIASLFHNQVYSHFYSLHLVSIPGPKNDSVWRLVDASIDQLSFAPSSQLELDIEGTTYIGKMVPPAHPFVDILISSYSALYVLSPIVGVRSIMVYGIINAISCSCQYIEFMEGSHAFFFLNQLVSEQSILYSGLLHPQGSGKEFSFVGKTIISGDTTLTEFDSVSFVGDLTVSKSSLTVYSMGINGQLFVSSDSQLVLQSDFNDPTQELITLDEQAQVFIEGSVAIYFLADIKYNQLYPIFKSAGHSLAITWQRSAGVSKVYDKMGNLMEHDYRFSEDTMYVYIEPKKKEKIEWWEIAVIAVGGLIFLLLVAGISFFLWRRHKLKIGYLKVVQNITLTSTK